MKQTRHLMWTGLLVAAALIVPTSAAGETATPAQQGMDRLKSLAGTWEGKGPEGAPVTVTFTLTGENSAVMEHLSVGDMVTMYHEDGDHLMLTHYCAGNNQPRMRAAGLSGDGKSIAFKFHDITNLASKDAMYMKSLTITFQDATHITEEWTHQAGSKESPLTMQLTRVK